MEIDAFRRKPTSNTTISCDINGFEIPRARADSDAESSMMSNDIFESLDLELELDTQKKNDLVFPDEKECKTLGWARNIPVTLSSGFTVTEDFIVYNSKESYFLLGVPLLDKIHANIDYDKRELRGTFEGKSFTIPISVNSKKYSALAVEIKKTSYI